MDISTYLTNTVLASGKDCFAVGILGQPSTGKRTLANKLTEQLRLHHKKVATVFADECYYIEMMPGIRLRRSDLARDIREFQAGEDICIAGGGCIERETSVLVVLATLKYLPEDLDAWAALDYRVFITARDGRHRLQRRIELETRSKEEGGPGRSEADVVDEFTQEQLQEHAAIGMIRQAECVWLHDTNEIGRFDS